jgi:hypothetical protein
MVRMVTKRDPLPALHSSFDLLVGSLARDPNGPMDQTHLAHFIFLPFRKDMLLMLGLQDPETMLVI